MSVGWKAALAKETIFEDIAYVGIKAIKSLLSLTSAALSYDVSFSVIISYY